MKKAVAVLATLMMLAGIALAGAQTGETIATSGADSTAGAAQGTTAGMVATAVAVVAVAVAVSDSDNSRIGATRTAH